MLTFFVSFVGVKMALEVAQMSKEFATNFTWNRFLHFGVHFVHVKLQMMSGPDSIPALRTDKVFHTRMNLKMLL